MMSRIQSIGVIASLTTTILLSGCSSYTPYTPSAVPVSPKPVVMFDDHAMKADMAKRLAKLMKDTPTLTPHSELVKQLSRKTCTLDLPTQGYFAMPPSEIYQRALGSAVVVGTASHCKSKTCKKNHFSMASGVIIHSDGIVLTNYHVVISSGRKVLGMGIATQTGRTYLVDEVLAASKDDDVAILRLKDAKNLPAIPIYRDEPVGNPVTVVSHPTGQFYTLTQGYVSRYAKKGKRRVMNITADYAKGSSGGPVFNNRGDLIGLVASTNSIAYTTVPLSQDKDTKALTITQPKKKPAMVGGKRISMHMDHQMTFKNCVPSRAILDLIKSP